MYCALYLLSNWCLLSKWLSPKDTSACS